MGAVNLVALCLYGEKIEDSCRLDGHNQFDRPLSLLFNTECVGVYLLTRLLKMAYLGGKYVVG